MFFAKEKSIVGIDIGTATIKIAQVSHGATRTLDTYGLVNFVADFTNRGNKDVINKTAVVLKELISQARVTTKHCVASLPNSAVFTSIVELPHMSEKELASAMEFEGKKYIPLPLSEMNLSWSIVSQNAQANTLKVLLTAVPKQVIENYTHLFSQIGLELTVLDIEALALSRALIFDSGKNHVIIDIGAKSTSIIILKNGLLQLSRNVNVGGDTITGRIAQSLNISESRAEQFKRDFGVSQSTFLPESIKPVLNTIKNEVKQLLNLYQSQDSKVDHVTLVGGGANLPGLASYWSDLGVPVELGNPLKSVAYTQPSELHLKRFILHLPVAIGLALRTEG